MLGEQQQQSSSIAHQLQQSASPNTSLTSSSSPSTQAMAHEQMSLYELRELATRQQERIETTQRLIMNREQKLKYLKHDTLFNHSINEYDKNLQRLKESVSTQEIKLRQLRALKGQVQKQRCSNSNLCEYFLFYTYITTVDPIYSERGYSEYPLIVNGFLRTDR
jgi:hypothetical protein